jgi:PKD repeat protein
MKGLFFKGLISLLLASACEGIADYHAKAVPLTADFTVNDNTDSIRISSILDITNNSKGATSYIWQWGNGTSCTDQFPGISYPTAGTYTIILTTSNGSETAVDSQTVTVVTL